MRKRLLASLLSLVMVLTMLPAAALAADPPEEAAPVEDCICTELCTVENINGDCPVCGGEGGYAACAYTEPEETVPSEERPAEVEEPIVCTGEADCPAETHNEGCPLYAVPSQDDLPLEGNETTPSDQADPVGPNRAPAAGSGVYRVSSDNFLAQITEVENSEETEITFILTGDIKKNAEGDYISFSGIKGKHVTLTSAEDSTYSIRLDSELTGDITLDNVEASGASTIYACGHTFETTENFEDSISGLYGGGPEGENVNGDTNLILRGGTFTYVLAAA